MFWNVYTYAIFREIESKTQLSFSGMETIFLNIKILKAQKKIYIIYQSFTYLKKISTVDQIRSSIYVSLFVWNYRSKKVRTGYQRVSSTQKNLSALVFLYINNGDAMKRSFIAS